MHDVIIALDQGTTSSRAIAFAANGTILKTAQREFPQYFPHDGWVEHDPEDIWNTSQDVLNEIAAAFPGRIAALGITNQRETTLLWDNETASPVARAIVWQDRRTADFCDRLRQDGAEEIVQNRTGLCLDPYFSASKIAWLLDQDPALRQRAESGQLAFGTVDSFLIRRLTGRKQHVTDITNASRTGLFNIHKLDWDDELLRLFRVPRAILPEVRDSAGDFGICMPGNAAAGLSIAGVAGDQQAAAIGQGCVRTGMIKSTYGTGCFVLAHAGYAAPESQNRLLATIASGFRGSTAYALEGSIFIAGAAVQWLRDGLKLITSAAETEALAASIPSTRGVYLVPAFTGLGAPYWDAAARGALLGMTRDTDRAVLARATLESAAYQTADLIAAMRADGIVVETLRVDGGMVRNNWFCSFLANILNVAVARPKIIETTAAGAAFLAGLGIGRYDGPEDAAQFWRGERSFTPEMDDDTRNHLLAGWADAVGRIRG